jgi:hypothetical protein
MPGGAGDVGNRQVDLTEQTAADGADDHRDARDHQRAGEDAVQLVPVSGCLERVHQPGLDRARIKGVTEAEDHAGETEKEQAPFDRGHPDVRERAHR